MPPAPATPGSDDRGRATPPDSGAVARAVVAAWLVPGAGHWLVGETRKAAIFFGVLVLMVAVGLGFDGRLFPFTLAEPLVFLAAVSEWAMVVPRLIAAMADLGDGNVKSVTYEYGNTFLIVSGLLNTLVVLDVFDRARGRTRA